MIVRMKKVTALCLEDDTDRTLEALAGLGVLHLVPVREPQGADLDKTRKQLDRARDALLILRPLSDDPGEGAAGPDVPPRDIVEQTHQLRHELQRLEETRNALVGEQESVAPFGDLDPSTVSALADRGITVRLYHTTSQAPVETPDGVVLALARRSASGQYFALVGDTPDFTVDAREVPLPARSLAVVTAEIGETGSRIEKINDELRELGRSSERLADWVESLEQREEYLLAQAGMGASGRITYLQGYCPVHAVDRVRRAARTHGLGLVVECPAEDDAVPTLVRYPSWAKVMQPVFGFLGITPGYRESDISSSFFIFLTIFFAMIVGDAGYGLLFLILTAYAKSKAPRTAPAEPFRLLTVFSVGTMVWGVLTANYFGIDVALLPGALQALQIPLLVGQNNNITFSLLLGAIHLTIAHSWKCIVLGKDIRTLVQAGWICTIWTVFFTAGALLLNRPFPGWFIPISVAGVAAIVVGMIIQKLWMGVCMLALDLVSCFGDLMSYLRLFALGIASVKVADAFNTMAGDIGFAMGGAGGGGLVAGGAVMMMILTLGHGLNLILCVLSVLVHGIRLNALEFSMHMGMEWSGHEYKPFTGETLADADAAA